MTRWEVFRQVSSWLRPAFSATAPAILSRPVPWEMVIEAASHHLVTPALGWSLLKDLTIPSHVADYFEAVLDIMRLRNQAFLDELEKVVGALNAAGIRPALLKGAAFLADETYPDPGMRILIDLDILVPEPKLETASSALMQIGFGAPRIEMGTSAYHHHLPPQTHPATGITVELHRELIKPPFRRLVDSRNCFQAGRTTLFRGCELVIPSATDRVAHAIAHGQLSDRNYRRGVPELRQLLDLAVLRARHDGEIDWLELKRRFQAAGVGRVLADNLTYAEFLLGQPLPAGFEPRDDAIRRMKRAIERTEGLKTATALFWSLGDALTALRRDPKRLVTAVRKKRWRSVGGHKQW